MTFTQTITETFQVVSCYTCGVRFGIGGDLYRRVVTNAEGSIYCPSCGNRTKWCESEASKKIKELESKLRWESEHASRLKSRFDETQKSLVATKAVVTKLKKRVSAGVCPCCNRTFKQLSAHMAQKHPEFKVQDSV